MSEETSKHVSRMLDSLGLADTDSELDRTPERVAELLKDLFSGVHTSPPTLSTFDATSQSPVVIKTLPFWSMCVHHLLPFFGSIDIAYVPKDHMAGFGGFLRVSDHFSKKPQIQERLVEEIAEHLEKTLQPQGLLIRCQARQMCVEMRRHSPPSQYVSFASRGVLSTDAALRRELLQEFERVDSE